MYIVVYTKYIDEHCRIDVLYKNYKTADEVTAFAQAVAESAALELELVLNTVASQVTDITGLFKPLTGGA